MKLLIATMFMTSPVSSFADVAKVEVMSIENGGHYPITHNVTATADFSTTGEPNLKNGKFPEKLIGKK